MCVLLSLLTDRSSAPVYIIKVSGPEFRGNDIDDRGCLATNWWSGLRSACGIFAVCSSFPAEDGVWELESGLRWHGDGVGTEVFTVYSSSPLDDVET
jgi:hypothetical protein